MEDKKVMLLNSLIEKYSYQGAVRRLNKNGHFKRDYGHLINENIDLKGQLIKEYQDNIFKLLYN